jgi:PAS domain S-box-containing protein
MTDQNSHARPEPQPYAGPDRRRGLRDPRRSARGVGWLSVYSEQFRQIGGSVLATLTATVVRLLLQPFIGYDLPFITYFAAVFVSAWWFGFRPALLTVLLSAFLADLLFFPPNGSDGRALSLLSFIGLALFVGIGVGTAYMGQGRLDAQRRAEAEAAEARRLQALAEEEAARAEEEATRADEEAARAQRALGEVQSAAARLEWQAGLLEQTQDPVLVWELEGPLRYWNRGAERLYGWPREEVLGKRSHELLRSNPADASSVPGMEEHLRRQGEWRGELRQRTRDGRELVVESHLVMLAAPGGPPLTLETVRDITERKRVEAQLLHSQQMDAIGQLAGGVAHDFNNILTAISGYCGLLLEETPASDGRRVDIVGIEEAADRAASLTQQLLAFGRKQIMQPTVIDVREMIEDTGRMLRRLIGEHIDLALTTGPLLSPVLADRGQLSQVLVNLAVNARDAMPEGGRLTIEARDAPLTAEYASAHLAVVAGSYVLLAVSDTGHGMSPEVQARMFEPFYTTKPAGKGTGLGLSTAYGIVKQLGGHIFVYSELGHGTTVKVYLPRAEAAVSPRAHHELPSGRSGSETILVVEDDAGIRAVVQRILGVHGYTVLAAATPVEALELSAHHPGPIHLLLTDVVLPGTNGRHLAELLLRERPGLPVLYMSGYTDDAIVHHGWLDPDTEFLQKPFTSEVLLRRTRQVLDQQGGAGQVAAGA